MNTVTHTVAPPTLDRAKVTARIIARGSVLGRYEIVGSIGAGSMADVWLGRSTGHGGLARLLAIKTARPSLSGDPRLRAMLLREGALAAGIRHANVVDVLDVGEAGGVLFQVMSLVEGDSFAGLLQAAPLSLGVTIGIGIDALRGLHAAHELDIVHRDVSPQNILVGLDGLARISDFGIANVVSDDGETTGTLRGKFAYFAPEQARREPLDRRADVFAMGVVLWEALTGARLFKGRDVVETLERVLGAPITDPRTHAPELPAPIAVVVMRALERDAAARHASAEAMADALASAAHEAGVVVDRRNVARTVNALAGERVRTLIREVNEDAEPVSRVMLRGPGRRSRLALPLVALGIAAVVALVAVVALGLRVRSAPVVNAPPLVPHEPLVVRPARATVTPPPTVVPVSAPAPSSRQPPFE